MIICAGARSFWGSKMSTFTEGIQILRSGLKRSQGPWGVPEEEFSTASQFAFLPEADARARAQTPAALSGTTTAKRLLEEKVAAITAKDTARKAKEAAEAKARQKEEQN